MNLQDFINRWRGKKIDYDGVYSNQCVDLIKQYFKELGLFIPHGNAIDYQKNAHDGVIWIKNTPSGVPISGDVIVWGMKPYGHVGIFVEGDVKSFRSFDQNWPNAKGEPCEIHNHNYTNVLGWLRPPTQITTDSCQAQLEDCHRKCEDEIERLGIELAGKLGEIRALNDINKDCQTKLTATEKALADTNSQLKEKDLALGEFNRQLEALKSANDFCSERLHVCQVSLNDTSECLHPNLANFTGKELVVELFRRFWRQFNA